MPPLLKPAWLQRLDYLNRRTEAHSIRTRLAMCRSMGDTLEAERRGCLPCRALFCCPQAGEGWICFFSLPLTDVSLRVCYLAVHRHNRLNSFLPAQQTSISSFWCFFSSFFSGRN
ncbi:hypothetical protein TRIATDRAFT_302458 [Trichoderma atroviride IMI 206040]|uniref:Uncharacterized protein n=1 Tax=Hypocrea atroviridis (strain ATCC 20476 / IMI 206040) TaxID=452589 RepID=G9PA85_HYPAI|nr:uncharacterized protein TRIATDRAFT_302458 [Trichoderma atroviride IMI 206040]EHK39923.1 hypothetical protein TRIATDRAFT_302458 [Trichoderma atroviride IMI 206040]